MERVSKIIKFVQVIISFYATIVHFQNSGIWCSATNVPSVCKTADCKTLATMYLANMNKNGSACTDFHDYVCHGWAAQNPRPEHMDVWGVEETLKERSLKQLKKLLEDSNSSESARFAQAGALYKTCMKLPFVQRSSPSIIQNIMAKVGNWPMVLPKNVEIPNNVPWWEIDAAYLKRSGESALFSISIAGDLRKKNYPIPQLQRLMYPYGTLSCIKRYLPEGKKNDYKHFLKQIIETVAPKNSNLSMNVIDSDLEEVLKFRQYMGDLIWSLPEAIPDIIPTFDLLPNKDFQEWYDKQAPPQDTAKANWLELVPAILKNTTIIDPGTVYVEKPYFAKLANLLSKTPKRVIVNHIHLYFAERHTVPSPNAADELQYAFPSIFGAKCKIRSEITRWKWCIENHSMGTTLRTMYIAYAMQNKQSDISQLVTNAKNILEKQITESTWLDNGSKHVSINIIKNMTRSIGYPSWFYSNTSRDPYDVDPLEPDIYYGSATNRLYISPAFLQLPMYNLDMPYAVKYGSIGTTVGHELYHSVGPDVADGDGVWKPMWSEKMGLKYSARLKCFEMQYTLAKMPYYKKYNVGAWSNFVSTTGEDVADVMGLKLGYQAYKDKLKESKGNCPVLPGFEKSGCEQLFFIAFANQFCFNPSRSGEKRLLYIDPHSPHPVRVNSAVLNMKEFGLAFGCSPKDPMMSETKCDLWKG